MSPVSNPKRLLVVITGSDRNHNVYSVSDYCENFKVFDGHLTTYEGNGQGERVHSLGDNVRARVFDNGTVVWDSRWKPPLFGVERTPSEMSLRELMGEAAAPCCAKESVPLRGVDDKIFSQPMQPPWRNHVGDLVFVSRDGKLTEVLTRDFIRDHDIRGYWDPGGPVSWNGGWRYRVIDKELLS